MLLLLCAALVGADQGPGADAGSASDGPLGAERPAGGEADPGAVAQQAAPELAGFSLTRLQVPRDQLLEGGPARDAIHSVDQPTFASPEQASWVRGDTPVIGVSVGGEARAYPVHVMEYHQVVNDVVGGIPLVVTYDPITDIAVAYERTVEKRTLAFGVSGLILRSSFVLYDRDSDGLWSQFDGRAISGRFAGSVLRRHRTRVEPMALWYAREPQTRVLDRPEPRRIDYRRSPFSAYWISEVVPFPLEARDDRFHPKELVLGIETPDGTERAYIASLLRRVGSKIVDHVGEGRIRIVYDGETGTFSYDAPDAWHVTSAYWFAWKNLHPETGIWWPDRPGERDPAAGPREAP